MPYRDDLDGRRAAVKRLEDERDALLRELALVESLPTSRTLEARVLGAPTKLTRSSVIDEPFDPSSIVVLGDALSKSYGVTGRVQQRPRGLTWSADLAPRGRSVGVTIATDDHGRTQVTVADHLSPTRQIFWGAMGILPMTLNSLFRGQWAFFAGTVAFLAVALVALRRIANVPIARRREREAMAAETVIADALRLQGLRSVRARVEGEGEPEAVTEPTPDASASARAVRAVR